ncbi:MAG: SAM-dependent methyltransferase [Gammaproteobacteria bacterium]
MELVLGHFREEPAFTQIVGLVPGRAPDAVLSDRASNLSGMEAIGAPRSMHLVEPALDIVDRVLKPAGCALIKVFQGVGFQEFVALARSRFARVKLCKPEASRSRSPELYLLAKGFRLV